MHANDRTDVKIARAGDIVAIAGLKNTVTGETLCDQSKPIVLERMDFPDPVISIMIEPKTKVDLQKMGTGLNKLAQEDPSFHYSRDEETNQVRCRFKHLNDFCLRAFLVTDGSRSRPDDDPRLE